MKLWKAHGLGNDYLVWEEAAISLNKEYVQKICSRTQGIGGDGILEPYASDNADFGVRIWNPDGSIAEKSGNGLRIFAHWLHTKKEAPKSFHIDTGACVVRAEILEETIAIDMGHAFWEPETIPTTEVVWETNHKLVEHDLVLYTVGIGNPHCVSFFDTHVQLDELPWQEWGKSLEHDERFPNRINVQFAKVLSRKDIEIRIWERGAGETSASGSSSCAVASVAHRLGWVDDEICMHMPGGKLYVSIDKEGMICLIGPVEEIGTMLLHEGFLG